MADYKPTPTQEENDLAAQGQSVKDKEHDGSPTTETAKKTKETKETQAEKPAGGGYQTRQVKPSPPVQHPAATSTRGSSSDE